MVPCLHCGAALPVQATLGWAHLMLQHGLAFVQPGAVIQVYPSPTTPCFSVICRRCWATSVLAIDAPAAAA